MDPNDYSLSLTDDIIIDSKKNVIITSKPTSFNNWSKEEDEILLSISQNYNFKNWKKVSEFLPGRNHVQCSARYKRIKPGVVKGAWTEEEDKLLYEYVKVHGQNWSAISNLLSSRSGKQIRDRYLNTLQPGVNKNKFTEEEDELLLKKYKELGPKWSYIAQFFENRTGDIIKNRFYSSLRKKNYKVDYLRQKKLRSALGESGKVIEILSLSKNEDKIEKDEKPISEMEEPQIVKPIFINEDKKLDKNKEKDFNKYIDETEDVNKIKNLLVCCLNDINNSLSR